MHDSGLPAGVRPRQAISIGERIIAHYHHGTSSMERRTHVRLVADKPSAIESTAIILTAEIGDILFSAQTLSKPRS